MELLSLRVHTFGILIATAKLPSIWVVQIYTPHQQGTTVPISYSLATEHNITFWIFANFMVKNVMLGEF